MESSIDEILLLVLNFYHLTLDGGLGDELVDEDVPVLTHPVDPVEALPLTRGVPGRVQQQEMIGRGQVEANSTSLNKSRYQRPITFKKQTYTLRLKSSTLGDIFPRAWNTFTTSDLTEWDMEPSSLTKENPCSFMRG